jgi:hypothetical protein
MPWIGPAIGAGIGLLGSKSGGGKQQAQQTGWKPALSAVERNLLPGIKEFSTDYGQGQGLWTGSQLAPEDYNVRAGGDYLLGNAGLLGNRMNEAYQGLEGFMNYDPNDPINQARRDALGAQSRATFDQFLRPAVEDRGTGSGQFGGNQQALATGAAMQGLNRDIVSAEADMMNADRQRALQALGMAPAMGQAQLLPGQIQMEVGQQRTQRNQLDQLNAIQMYEAERNNRLRGLQDTSGLLTPLTGLGTTASSSGQGNAIQGALGGALLGSQLGGIFNSNSSSAALQPIQAQGLGYIIPQGVRR